MILPALVCQRIVPPSPSEPIFSIVLALIASIAVNNETVSFVYLILRKTSS